MRPSVARTERLAGLGTNCMSVEFNREALPIPNALQLSE
jgi:hypothetical protein